MPSMHHMSSAAEHFARKLDPVQAPSSRRFYVSDAKLHDYPVEIPANKSSDIWNGSKGWMSFTFWHPRGVISNVNNYNVIWANVDYLSLSYVCLLSTIAYPAVPVIIFLFLVVAVSFYIQANQPELHEAGGRRRIIEDVSDTGFLSPSRLTPASQRVYNAWKIFCCCIPVMLIFG